MKNILIPLAAGFEEIEAVTCIDGLRRADLNVVTASIGDSKLVEGDHKIKIETDTFIDQIKPAELKGIVLPGGMPGASNLKNNTILLNLIKKMNKKNKLIAAICAAPIVLEEAGVLADVDATSYPGFGSDMPSCNYVQERVVKDNNIITARGPGIAMEFLISIIVHLFDENKASQFKEELLTNF